MEENKNQTHILILDADTGSSSSLSADLISREYHVSAVSSWSDGVQVLKRQRVDLVVASADLLKVDGKDLLEELRGKQESVPVILMADHRQVDMAADAMRRGAVDFILRPLLLPELRVRIEKNLESFRSLKKRQELFVNPEGGRNNEALAESAESRARSEKLALMGRLVSGMAHEINNPLTAVIGYAQLLLDTGGQDMNRQLKVIKDQAQRCGKIIQDLMLFSSNRKPLLSDINICEVAEAAGQSLVTDLKLNRIKLSFTFSDPEIRMLGDAALLKRAFAHLILNAIHALERVDSERKIEIAIKTQDSQIQIEVKDNGHGMPKDVQSCLFEPFFTTREVGKGSGLGLSFCHGLISGHGGNISVKSEKDAGTTFTILLPRKMPIRSLEPRVENGKEKPWNESLRKVLLIEDEDFVADFIAQVLSLHGFEVHAVNDGAKGYQALKERRYDVVLCDFRIPKMNGLEIFDKIQKEKGGLANRFILVTASISFGQDIEEESLKERGILYLAKPFTGEDLMKVIKPCLSEKTSL